MPRKLALGLAAAVTLGALAPSPASAYQAEYRPSLTKDGDVSLRFLQWNQIWGRVIENNPGAADDWTPDVALRRIRFLTIGRIKDDVTAVFHFGINNQTINNNVFEGRAPAFFVHDAWAEFKLFANEENRIDFGGGLLYWNGISRMTNASTLNFLAIDSPITTWPTINESDQFARHMGFYLKGHVAGGLFDYRVAVVQPFVNDGFSGTPTNTFGSSGYFKFQFWDKESNVLPYAVGTYLGAKQVANLGAGYHVQPGGGQPTDDGSNGDIVLLGADAFLDTPFGKDGEGGALTAYAGFYFFDFGGTNPLDRVFGIANVTGNPGGNAYPVIGDGVSVYTQVGYLLPGRVLDTQIQPYVTAQLNAWDAYDDIGPVLEAGSNFFFVGHHAKMTINWRLRPIMAGRSFDRFGNEFMLQLQTFL